MLCLRIQIIAKCYMISRPPGGLSRTASTGITNTSGGLDFCRQGIFPAGQDESLVIVAHSNSELSSGKTETDSVVSVIGRVVVAVGRTAVPAVVDPRAATQNAVIACSTFTLCHFIPIRAGDGISFVYARRHCPYPEEWLERPHSRSVTGLP